MKNLLVVAAMVMAAAPAAMASKARVNALGNSRQIVDFQNAFDRPYQFMALGTQATIEWGSADTVDETTTASTKAATHAEGGFLMKSDDMAYGAYLGRRSDAFNTVVEESGIANLLNEQNPLNLFYASKMGEWTWGVTAKYSNGKNDVLNAKASSSGLALGAAYGAWEFELVQGLTGKSEVGADSVESKGMTEVGVGYKINENMEVYGNYGMVKADITDGGTDSTYEQSGYEVGFVNTVSKTDDANFFYGVAYKSGKVEKQYEASMLPVWMGIEANATSWMVMRASVKQNVIINETKLTAANDKKLDLDSIAFNAGVGLKLGKGMLDATFGTANQGTLGFNNGSSYVDSNGNDATNANFLTNVSYTYNF